MADETKVTEELTQAPEAVQAAAPEEAPETASAEAPAAPVESMADYEWPNATSMTSPSLTA